MDDIRGFDSRYLLFKMTENRAFHEYGIQKVIKKVIKGNLYAGKETPAKVLLKINRPRIGLFFFAFFPKI